jgi:transcriptional regulator, Spx/MgsR family
MLFICYPKCTTCQKARKWLVEAGLSFEERDIKSHPPTESELRNWHILSGLPLTRFLNTSGQIYRQLGLKERVPTMDEGEILALLATDGMLVKRPLLIGDGFVLIGFREKEWEATLFGE